METRQDITPEAFGSRKALYSLEVAVCRELFFNIIRQRKVNITLGLYDAQSCYDTVVHSLTSMVCQSIGVPQATIDCMLTGL